jgi:glutaredoxin
MTPRKKQMPDVTIYSRPTCGPCRTVKYFLTKKGIPFKEKNVEVPAYLAEYQDKAEVLQLPLILVGDQQVSGGNIGLLSRLLML